MAIILASAPAFAGPPICPHVNNWNGAIGSWCGAAPWVKVMSKDDVVRAKANGNRVFYRPYDVPGTDQGWCPVGGGISQGNAVVANLNAIGQANWPDAIGFRNEFNNDADATPREFLNYYDTIRASGYSGLIVFGSWAVWWPAMSDWADADIQAAVNKADAIELHEYFDLTVACQQYILCHRHVDSINRYPYIGNKPIFIGEFGSDYTNCDDPQHRRGWNDRGKLTAEQYIDQMAIYRAGCAKQIVAAFVFQQGATNDWFDFEVMHTPLVTSYMASTWTNPPGYASGYVRSSSGQAIQGAIVTALPAGINVVTSASGKYWLYNLPAGTCSVTVSKPGYANSTGNISITANQTTIRDFTLTSASPGTLAGSVRDPNSNPISGAVVSTNIGGYRGTTDSSGNYAISSVGAGTYDLTASRAGFQSSTQTGKVVSSNSTTTANFTLASNFQGLTNGDFEGGWYDDPDADHRSGNGWRRFSLAGSSKCGVIYGGAHSPNYSQSLWEASYTAGVYQQAVGTLAGNSYTASVWVKGADTGVKFRIGVDPNGGTDASSTSIQWSPESAPGATWTKITTQATAAGSTVTVFLKAQNTVASNRTASFDDAELVAGTGPSPGTITGNVKNTGGQNLSGAVVTTNTGGYSATTDASGNYTMSNVASGTYDLTASKSGYNSAVQTGVYVGSGQTATANFTLSAATGTELLANGSFASGCTGWSHSESPSNIYWGCGNKAYPGTSSGAGGHSWNAYLSCGGYFCDRSFTGEQHQDNVPVAAGASYNASAKVYYEPVKYPGVAGDQKERLVLTFNNGITHTSNWQTHSTANGWDTITYSSTVPTGATAVSFRVELSHVDGQWSGTGAVDECSLISQPPCTAPSITTHPQIQVKDVGQSATFTVAASGTAPLAYQWRKNDSAINGATSASYIIASVTTPDAGSYSCLVSNACGSATSSAAALVVRLPVYTIAAAKGYPDGTVISLSGKTVTASNGSAFWVEESDRSCGIKAVASNSLAIGARVSLWGTLATVDGERVLQQAGFVVE